MSSFAIPIRSKLVLFALLTTACVCLQACSWSVPADPGLNAQRRTRTRGTPPAPPARADAPIGGDRDEGARALYLNHCSRCHAPFPPTHVSADRWPVFVAKYGPQAGLFGEDRARVLRWLQANAAAP